MSRSNEESIESALTCAAIFSGLGFLILVRSVYADFTDNIVLPRSLGMSWMNPGQGYLASGLIFLVAGYALMLAYRRRSSKERDE